jgi:hypothetical protein
MVIKTKKLQNKGKKMRKTNKKVMKGGGNRSADAPILNTVTGLPINHKELERQKAAIQNAMSSKQRGMVNITAQIKKNEAEAAATTALKLKNKSIPTTQRKWWKKIF